MVYDTLVPSEQKVVSRILSPKGATGMDAEHLLLPHCCPDLGFPMAEPDSSPLQPTGFKTAAHLPNLLPPSALMR